MPDAACYASDVGGRWRIFRGDAVMRLAALADGSVDSFVTDPPYGINLKLQTGKSGRPKSIAGDGAAEARLLWERWIPEAHRAARPDSAHVVFGTWKSPWMHELLARHFRVVGAVAWDKRIPGLGWHLRGRWEMFYLCHKGKPPVPKHGTAPADVWQVTRERRPLHPCQKPIDLMRRCVQLACPNAGGLVADPFAGIFSTGVAAVLEGRRFWGSELDKRFCGMGRGRLVAAVREFDADEVAAAAGSPVPLHR